MLVQRPWEPTQAGGLQPAALLLMLHSHGIGAVSKTGTCSCPRFAHDDGLSVDWSAASCFRSGESSCACQGQSRSSHQKRLKENVANMTNTTLEASLVREWEYVFRIAGETMDQVKRQPFEVMALEIDGQQVWARTPPEAIVEPLTDAPSGRDERPMVSVALMGSHTHMTLTGVVVHVWQRGGKYLVRGRLDRRPFGETLGDDSVQATARLRQVLTEIENGSYVRASDARKRKVSRRSIPRLTLRELVGEFIAHKRQTRGRQTAGNYSSRLTPVLDFAEKAANLKHWPLAVDIDHEFAGSLRAFLFEFRSTRNGRPGAEPRKLSERQVINILQCLRTALHWARNAAQRKLPADWPMPLTRDLIGKPRDKDPLRRDKVPVTARIALVQCMDLWQMCQLVFSLVLTLRPDEAAGLIISDVNYDEGWLEFGAQFKDANFTKARTAFNVPFPKELLPVLRACVGGRNEGPLLQRRAAFERKRRTRQASSLEELDNLFQAELSRQPRETVQSEQDRKVIFRKLLRRLGGVSEDVMNKEFKHLLRAAGLRNGSTLYTLRSAVTTSMHAADIPLLELRYLTGHATNDIMNTYTSLDPVSAMHRYFDTIRPLLDAIASRCEQLGLV